MYKYIELFKKVKLKRETKTKCATITLYIGTYKPMQWDSNPHPLVPKNKIVVEKLL